MEPPVSLRAQKAESRYRCVRFRATSCVHTYDGSDRPNVDGVFKRPWIRMYTNGGQTLGSSHCWPVSTLFAGGAPSKRSSCRAILS